MGRFEVIGHAICHQDNTITRLGESAFRTAPFVLQVRGLKCPSLIAIGCALWRDTTELASAFHQQKTITQLGCMDLALICHVAEQQRGRGVSRSCRLNRFQPLLMNQGQRCRQIETVRCGAQDPPGNLAGTTCP
ncbi:hypothetical protein HMPREF3014_23715 [Pseudomonas sp. HMSC065H01]|nr:hypothetical protein HMPREF3014_23715 [Pseudomonas sp. HMSC065H01]OFR09735.1 hypothetical protein HMPREF2906_17250 [Pseudomonas sp. HMSC065H02]